MNSGFKSDESPDLNTDGTAQAGEYVNAEGVPGFFYFTRHAEPFYRPTGEQVIAENAPRKFYFACIAPFFMHLTTFEGSMIYQLS
jgi:hypothetical protein